MCDLSVERNSLDGAEPLPRVITRRGEETMEDHADIMPLSSYDEDLQHKTILVGDSSVGKTSLLVQFDQGKFLPGSFTSTVGIGFTNKMVTVDGMNVKLQKYLNPDNPGNTCNHLGESHPIPPTAIRVRELCQGYWSQLLTNYPDPGPVSLRTQLSFLLSLLVPLGQLPRVRGLTGGSTCVPQVFHSGPV
ncbi:ras-related protein Rab-37 isoform X9 [Dendrobates tinctorius]|uniref:ras-related protein Rab-37 isoform X9 n=1 Tax=Dendrobates tinctorius TaxID=92724 RepID=UPI003CCA1AF0